jgi:phytol kinase
LNPWLGILIVLLSLGGAFLGSRLLQRYAAPNPELLRKLIHVVMGLVAAAFPWLFERAWPVLLLAGLSLLALILLRSGLSTTRSLQGVLHGVKRTSWGELLFPVSVALLFLLADGDPLLYSVPILILTLADAVAALIGVYYGQVTFSTLEGAKSIEGSLGFFIVAFLCVHVPVLLFAETGRLESLLIGLLMGIIVMLFEAVAWRGLDNLFIPVASYGLLQSYLSMDSATLTVRLVVILLLGLSLLFWRRRSTLDDSALVAAILVAYGSWTIGGLTWLLVPVLLFLVTTLLTYRAFRDVSGPVHNVYALLGIAGPAFLWLILNRSSASPEIYFAYAVAFSAHATMLGVSRAHARREQLPAGGFAAAVAQGLLVLLPPFLFIDVGGFQFFKVAAFGACTLLLAGFAFLYLQPSLDHCPGTPERWRRQALIATGASVLAWISMHVRFSGV